MKNHNIMDETNLLYKSSRNAYDSIKDIDSSDIDLSGDFQIGMESNYSYDIIQNEVIYFKDRKCYLLDFISNIAIFNNLGYTYKIKCVKSYYSLTIKYYVY